MGETSKIHTKNQAGLGQPYPPNPLVHMTKSHLNKYGAHLCLDPYGFPKRRPATFARSVDFNHGNPVQKSQNAGAYKRIRVSNCPCGCNSPTVQPLDETLGTPDFAKRFPGERVLRTI